MSTGAPVLQLKSRSQFADGFGTRPSARSPATKVYPLPFRRRDQANHWPAVDISPREIANRRVANCDGMAAEIVQVTRRERIDIRFRAPVHLLVVVEQAVRVTGETSVEGLPRSTLRDLRRKLTFVPAGCAYHEWHEPSQLPRAVYLYFDPEKLLGDLKPEYADRLNVPRLFFEDAALWETAFKLRSLMESSEIEGRLCFEALGVILAHELVRPSARQQKSAPPARGGLAAWQQRVLIDYIEANLAEQIPLATLARLVQLSPFHFCRAFKQSFGVPPHRYHVGRRIEHAKKRLAKSTYSVTDIGLSVGFSETSSFTAAFRKATGMTPTAYHRSLA